MFFRNFRSKSNVSLIRIGIGAQVDNFFSTFDLEFDFVLLVSDSTPILWQYRKRLKFS